MGLTSLAYLNRSGSYNFWNNSWDSLNLYKRYYFKGIYFNTLFQEIFNNVFFLTIFSKISKKHGLRRKYNTIKPTNTNDLFWTKVWYLKYQLWVVLVINYYKLSYTKNIKKI